MLVVFAFYLLYGIAITKIIDTKADNGLTLPHFVKYGLALGGAFVVHNLKLTKEKTNEIT